MTNPDELFQSFQGTKVLLVGDLMVDSYMWGTIERMSPEAPVPVVHISKKESRLGGAGNVGVNCKAMGANVLQVGYIGDDDAGKKVKSIFEEENLSTQGLFVGDRPTTVKTRVISDNKHVLRVDEEDPTYPKNDQQFVQHVLSCLESFGPEVIILQDYNKGVLTSSVIKAVIERANQLNIPTIVDPKKVNFLEYKEVTLYKPNLKEIQEGLGLTINPKDTQSVSDGVEKLKNALNSQGVLLTLSEHGVFIKFQNTEKHIPAFKRNIVDVSGAGDTVVSVAALALAKNLPPEEVALLANLSGGLVCEEVGVVPINPGKLKEEFAQNLNYGKQ